MTELDKCDSILDRHGNREVCMAGSKLFDYVVYGGIASVKTQLCTYHAQSVKNKIKSHWRMNKLMEVDFGGVARV